MRPIFYDTETTGLKPDSDRIIELAAYDPIHQAQFVRFINPGMPIPKEATAIHKISDAMVAEAPTFAVVAQEFIQFCSGEVILIAHNNDSFDAPFLKYSFEREGLSMPSWPFIDSLKWARKYRPDLPRHTLQFLRELLGIPPNQAHRALDDVMVLHEVFSFLIDDLPLSSVLELSQKQQKIEKMPFGKHQGIPLTQLPEDYLQWLIKSGSLDKEENRELKEALRQFGRLPKSV